MCAAIDTCARSGISLASAFEGLPFDQLSVRKLRRVSWDHYCEVIERLETLVGGPEATRTLTEETYHDVLPEVRWLAGAFVAPKPLLQFVVTVIDPVAFPMVDFACEHRSANELRFTVSLHPHARSCLTFFNVSAGAFRGFPRHLGLPSADVIYEIDPRHGVYDVRLPPSRTLVAQARRNALAFFNRINDDGPTFDPAGHATAGDADDGIEARVKLATQSWALTPRQVEVLALLVRGEANKEIARSLDCAENTVELHVTQLLRKANASTRAKLVARFWSDL